MTDLPQELNTESRADRLRNLQAILTADVNILQDRPQSEQVNNHVHTFYSFSPYSPTSAVWTARWSGLQAVGSVDHDSISAASELLEAGRLIGLATTVGCEIRVNLDGTAMEGRRLNNPDSKNIIYMVIHGVPSDRIKCTMDFLKPINHNRNKRNRKEIENLNALLFPLSVSPITFEQVSSLSKSHENGSITERHILLALCNQLIDEVGTGERLRRWVEDHFKVQIPDRPRSYLDDADNPHYRYDLLGVLKSRFLPRFFVQPDNAECVSVYTAARFARRIGAIPAYAYLGDVGDSPTGDKMAEKFEDEFLDELIPELTRMGFCAVTYMPPRNTRQQLRRVMRLCRENNLMEISGVDINSSRQVFTCDEILDPQFHHLIDMTWALIAHEKLASLDPQLGLFREDSPVGGSLSEQLACYSRIGRSMDPARPESIMDGFQREIRRRMT